MLRAWLVLTALVSSTAFGGDLGEKIDPAIHRVIRTGIHGAMQRLAPVPGRAKVLVELAADADDAAVARLEQAGAVVSRADGAPGVPGVPQVVTELLGGEVVLGPSEFTASTVKVYAFPFVTEIA